MANGSIKGQIIFLNDNGKTSTQSINHLNPEAGDANFIAFLKEISNLQKNEVKEYRRVETRTVSE